MCAYKSVYVDPFKKLSKFRTILIQSSLSLSQTEKENLIFVMALGSIQRIVFSVTDMF